MIIIPFQFCCCCTLLIHSTQNTQYIHTNKHLKIYIFCIYIIIFFSFFVILSFYYLFVYKNIIFFHFTFTNVKCARVWFKKILNLKFFVLKLFEICSSIFIYWNPLTIVLLSRFVYFSFENILTVITPII